MSATRRRGWTLAIVSVGLFMVVLDNLVVSVALPSIHRDLGASIQSLEWTVNAYTLSYAVLLLTGAALGDRFGRKRMFMAGIALFTVSSAAAALAPSIGLLIVARAIQGAGAAIATPLTLTLLADAYPPDRRGFAIGVWSGISGIAVALGPLVGGAMVQAASWHWIFWLNVPIGAVLVPLAGTAPGRELRTRRATWTCRAWRWAPPGLFGLVFGLIRSQSLGWTSTEVLVSLAAGAALLVGFVIQERRTETPMLPMEFFARRGFAVTNVVSLSMYFGMFGSIFFLSQFLQNVLGNSPLQAGVKLLVWTGATMIVAPLSGYFSERYGARLFMAAGLGLQAIALGWLAAGDQRGHELRQHDRPVRARRLGHGAGVRPVGQRGAGLGALRPGRQGLGRHQRHPRAGRRAGHRGAGHGVHQPRRLRVRGGVRQRPDPGDVGRHRGPGRRRPDPAACSRSTRGPAPRRRPAWRPPSARRSPARRGPGSSPRRPEGGVGSPPGAR